MDDWTNKKKNKARECAGATMVLNVDSLTVDTGY